jgi:hypothetical protein
MAKPILPKDAFGEEIPVLAPGATVTLTAGAASTNVALPPDDFVLRVAAVNDCYINFGTAGVTASGTSMFFPKGSELFALPNGATHMAVIQHTTGGVVSVTVME